jgi:SAM-dependent methyltransferase
MNLTEEVGMIGAAPVLSIGKAERPSEQALYEKLWAMDEYRKVSPGEHVAQVFLEQAKPARGSKVLDLGCGTGRGGYMLAVLGGMDVTFVDFAENSLDADIVPALTTQNVLHFVQADLTMSLPVMAEYGFCTDVMEHIPSDDVVKVLKNILRACQHVFFQIATEDDVMGSLVGHRLHLSVHPFDWWLAEFQKLDCVVHWSKEVPGAAMFYVTAWQSGHAVVDYGVLNTTEELVKGNVRHNIFHNFNNEDEPWQQIVPHETNDMEVMLLGGGPSLAEFEDEIKVKRAEGIKLVTMNGAYNWAIERGLRVSAQIVVDARPFNARFTRPVLDLSEDYPGCKYLIASQVDPSVLQGLPVERTYLWHTTADMFREILDERYDRWYGIPGGSTVLLRAIPLLRILGYHQFHLYGCDSCIARAGDQVLDHAYPQPENAPEPIMPVNVGGKIYACYAWHVAQAQQFIDMIRFMGHEIELNIPGDGLLAHILKHGAAEFDKSVFLQ